MAIIKHLSSKNSNYYNAIEYLTQKYNEELGKPTLDENGQLQERDEYRIAYINSSGNRDDIKNWERDCIKTNLKYGKNKDRSEIKTHHYIVAFENQDPLTIDELQALGEEFALKKFPGHQILVAAHPGNHVHIVINSVRDAERNIEPWMLRRTDGTVHKWEYMAGYKHQANDNFMNHIKRETMQFCISRGLGQVDLFKAADIKRSNGEYFAEKDAEWDKKKTYKNYIRETIDEAKKVCKTVEEFGAYLREKNVVWSKRGKYVRFMVANGQERWMRQQSLGSKYTWDAIAECLALNKRWELDKRNEIQRAIDAAKKEGVFRLPEYVNKKNVPYQTSIFAEDGHRRSVVEVILILAIVAITGDVEDYMLPKWQQDYFRKEETKKSEWLHRAEESKRELYSAIDIAKEMGISTLQELSRVAHSGQLKADDERKLQRLKRIVYKALNGKYCMKENLKLIREENRIRESLDYKMSNIKTNRKVMSGKAVEHDRR